MISFDSAERAVREFREQLNRAGQILEQGNWLGKGGETIGERALVVYSTEKTNDLSAVILLRRDSRLFEVSSSCLRNLLEFEKVWFRN